MWQPTHDAPVESSAWWWCSDVAKTSARWQLWQVASGGSATASEWGSWQSLQVTPEANMRLCPNEPQT